MAKKDKSTKPAEPAITISAPPASSTDTVVAPDFSGDVLKKLQQKIRDGMQKVNSETSKPQKNDGKVDEKASGKPGKKDKQQDKKKKKEKKDRAQKPEEQKEPVSKPDTQAQQSPAKVDKNTGKKDKAGKKNAESKAQEKQPQSAAAAATPTAAEPRGKKRGRDGEKSTAQQKQPEAKATGSNAAVPNTDNKKAGKGKSGKKSLNDEDLLKEILELGGTKEDLDLVKGLDSDDDEDAVIEGQEAGNDKAIRGDLEKMMAGMGFNAKKFEKEVIVSDEEEEEEEEEGEEDDDEEDDDDEEEVPDRPKVESTYVKGKLLFPPRPDWHTFELPELPPPESNPSRDAIHRLHERAKELLKEENTLYSTSHLLKTSDRQFLSTIMASGTLSDKVSALTLVCQESPLHTTKSLDTLLGLSKKKSRSQAIAAIAAIKDLFASGVILPSDRKLRAFSKQPQLGSEGVTDLHLMVWAYEDWLKSYYFEVLQVLEGLASDQLEFARSHAVGYIWELLKEKPEQEANLLRMLVNKLGDKDKKVASKVSFLLLQLQQTHPAMKQIIINSIESEVLFRPGNSPHAKYYAIITLNQTIISAKELEVANKLLDLYFAVFTGLLSKPKQDARNKALEEAAKKQATPDGKPNANPKLNKKAKKRIEEAEKLANAEEELSAKLISAVLTGVNRAFPFSKINDELFNKHVDTLFRITHSANFNTSVQALMLIHQVSAAKQVTSDRFYRTLYESMLDQRLITSSKQAMYLNLLFKAIKSDSNIKRVKAFVKRLVQVSTVHQPAFICGVFYLLSELEAEYPSLRMMLDTPEEGEEEEEEVFRDAVDEDDEDEKKKREESERLERERKGQNGDSVQKKNAYDGRKRDPEYSNADKSCLWEIIPFLSHFHPSVALYASSFLYKRQMPNKPDLSLYTLTHFLDRFVFRNPTTRQTTRGHSIMQPLPGAGGDTKGLVLAIRGTGKAQQSVNSEQFWKKKVEDVAPDEVFFHQYFAQRGTAAAKERKAKGRKGAEDGEDGEDGSDKEEKEIWDALVKSRPELEDGGDVDMDDDDDEEDLELDMSDMSDDSDDDDAEEGSDGSGDEESGGVTLDDAMAAFQKSKQGAGDDSDDEQANQDDEDSDDEAAVGLDSEGSDVWASDDDVDVPSDIDMDLDAAFEAELQTGASAGGKEESKKEKRKEKGGKKGSKAAAAAEVPEKSKGKGQDEDEEDGKKTKKRKLKHLPMFASASDYAHLLSDSE